MPLEIKWIYFQQLSTHIETLPFSNKLPVYYNFSDINALVKRILNKEEIRKNFLLNRKSLTELINAPRSTFDNNCHRVIGDSFKNITKVLRKNPSTFVPSKNSSNNNYFYAQTRYIFDRYHHSRIFWQIDKLKMEIYPLFIDCHHFISENDDLCLSCNKCVLSWDINKYFNFE